MNSIAELIALRDPSYVLLAKSVRAELSTCVLLYLFRGCDSSSLSSTLKAHLNWSGQDCIDFRKSLSQSGYLQKNLKLYTYSVFVGAKPKAEDFGIYAEDTAFLRKVQRSQSVLQTKLVTLCRKAASKGYPARTLESFDSGLYKACMSLQQDEYCEKFVGKKFKFLTDTGQKDAESLVAEMLEYGLRAAYRAYPEVESVLHLTNIMKQAIHNRGINIIKEETAAKRLRMTKNGDGTFNGVLLSLQFADFEQTFMTSSGTGGICNTLMCGLDGNSADMERVTDVDRRRDLSQAVLKVAEKCTDPVASRFLSLLMGEHDPDFSDYLKVDNTEALGRLPRSKYVNHARQFLGMTVPVAKSYFALWQSKLADFRN